jgi:excisionase family DNA binding protein
MIKWVRYKHAIAAPLQDDDGTLTVGQLAERFGVSRHVVYYWIERGLVDARHHKRGTPYRISLQDDRARRLQVWVVNSSRIAARRHSEHAL